MGKVRWEDYPMQEFCLSLIKIQKSDGKDEVKEEQKLQGIGGNWWREIITDRKEWKWWFQLSLISNKTLGSYSKMFWNF